MILKDAQAVLRSLWKNSGFTTLTVGLLALGMGASIAVFSLVDSVLLKPLPFPDAERVFAIGDAPPAQMNLVLDEVPLHPRQFQFIAANSRAFEYVAGFK